MPKKQAVYGKRPKAACNPTNIFASPDSPKRKAVETIKILSDNEIERRKSRALEVQIIETPVRNRRPLGEINGNAVLHVEVPKEKKKSTKSKQSRTKRRVEDEAAAEKKDIGSETLGEKVVPEAIHVAPQSSDLPDTAADCAVVEVKAQPQIVVPAEEQIEATEAMAQEIEVPAEAQSTDLPTDDPYTEHCASLLELTSYPVSSFSNWADGLREDFSLVKIAEASFGEVYRLSLHPEAAAEDPSLPLSKNDESVLKVIALAQPPSTLPKSKRDRERALKKAENMSKPADVASELKLLQCLSDIPGFTNFRDLRVLRGRPPGPFAEAFEAFNAAQKAADKELSIFPDPAKKASYSKDQLWAVIEMQDAGTDLEKLVAQGVSSSIWVVWDIFWQVVLALAKGEEEAEFEHRDLHLGNICVRTPPEGFDEAAVDVTKSLGFTSFEATLIDYTVSRASMVPASAASKDDDDQVAYIDLANDPHLFYGDSAEEYQYDIYRYMRGSIYYSSPYARFPNDGTSDDPTSNSNQNPEENENSETPLPTPPTAAQMAAIAQKTGRSWRQFHPQTNLVWLHYILYMLLEQMSWPARKAPSKKTKPLEHARWKRAKELEAALLKVQEELDPGWLGEEGSLGRSGEIVAWAVEEGWLGVGDVVGGAGGGEFEVFDVEQEEDAEEEEDELVKVLGGLALAPSASAGSKEEREVEGKGKKGTRKASKKRT
jgi:serine/threonine-protein kinase haspin